VVSAPTATHDTDEDLVTYSFRAEPADFQEMFDRLEISHFNGHYTKVIVIGCDLEIFRDVGVAFVQLQLTLECVVGASMKKPWPLS
jgi:hypothetical protein